MANLVSLMVGVRSLSCTTGMCTGAQCTGTGNTYLTPKTSSQTSDHSVACVKSCQEMLKNLTFLDPYKISQTHILNVFLELLSETQSVESCFRDAGFRKPCFYERYLFTPHIFSHTRGHLSTNHTTRLYFSFCLTY